MPNFLMKRWHGYHIVFILIFCVILIALLTYEHWLYGIIGLAVLGLLAYYLFYAEKAFKRDFMAYVATLSLRVKKAGAAAIQQLPIGMILYDEHKRIEWHNPFIAKILGDDQLLGKEVATCFPNLHNWESAETVIETVLNDRVYAVEVKPDERLLYVTDVNEWHDLENRYQDEQIVFGILHLDNLDEVTQEMDDQESTLLQTSVIGAITDWANAHDILIRRYSDKFFMIFHLKTLQQLEETRFDILDTVREMTAENKIPITLSIGVGSAYGSLFERARVAQSSLDIALGRGGDQAAVKKGERMTFYGGKSNAVEKRTRVRARVVSHALRNLIRESEQVLIVGHEHPDMDAIGAAIGVWKAAHLQNKDAYIVLNEENPSITHLMEAIYDHDYLGDTIISGEQALSVCERGTLVVVVDTHRPSMTIEPKLLEKSTRVVVIDHHRRSEEFVEDPVLVYMEPYASSTCELVTELLEYQTDHLSMDQLEATALLAGIVVDTKSFISRTGSRTFEAASFLRRHGANMSLVQTLLKEDLDMFVKRAEIMRHTETVLDNIAIAVAEEAQTYDQLLIAQTADALLNMTGIEASFVIARRQDGVVSISARSLGNMNVQVIMEQLGGGGHMTNAATQMTEETLDEAKQQLLSALGSTEKKGEMEE